MYLYSVEARDALYTATDTQAIPHLFTVVTDPWFYDGSNKVIMVNISSIKTNRTYDPTCVITPHEAANDFISRNSYVIYKFAEVREESKVNELVRAGRIQVSGRMANSCFRRMADGITRSRETPIKVKNAYEHYLRHDV